MIGKHNKKPDIPATSQPMKCGKKNDAGKKCGNIAHDTISTVINIMGKDVPVKLPLCPHHLGQALDQQTRLS